MVSFPPRSSGTVFLDDTVQGGSLVDGLGVGAGVVPVLPDGGCLEVGKGQVVGGSRLYGQPLVGLASVGVVFQQVDEVLAGK